MSYYIDYTDLENREYKLGNMQYIHADEKKVVILDSELDTKIAISKESVGNKSELLKLNRKLELLGDYGYRIGNYVEINLNSICYFRISYEIESLLRDYCKLKTNGIEIAVRGASDIYIILTDIVAGYYTNVDDYITTISFKGVTKANYKEYIQQFVFLLGLTINERAFTCDDGKTCICKLVNNYPKQSRYIEPIYFYAEGVRIFNTEMSPLYFYKVIEYFFVIVRKNEFQEAICRYNTDKDMDCFINKITKIYKEQEIEQLKCVINYIQMDLKAIIKEAVELDIIKSDNIDLFSEHLYLYRNSIVHGKSDFKFELKIPDMFSLTEKDLYWTKALKQISQLLIVRFCCSI